MNRQVPETIAIVGNGRVAHHMRHYFDAVGQPYTHWFRSSSGTASHPTSHPRANQSRLAAFKHKLKKLIKPSHRPDLAATVAKASVVLLLINDDQIIPFLESHPELNDKTCVHFSGSLYTELALGCHPLMTFGGDFYALEQYRSIPFVVDEGVDFQSLFPLLTNPVATIKPADKVKYHACCVMAGNFSQMLWQAMGKEFADMGLPEQLMAPYLLQNTQNFIDNPAQAATGPFVRGDMQTIEKHLQALQGHQLADIYRAFYHWQKPTVDQQHRSQS